MFLTGTFEWPILHFTCIGSKRKFYMLGCTSDDSDFLSQFWKSVLHDFFFLKAKSCYSEGDPHHSGAP